MKSHLLLLSMVTTIAVAQTPSYPDAAASDPLTLGLMQGFPPAADKTIRFIDGSSLKFPNTRWSFSHIRELVPTARVARDNGTPTKLPYALKDLDGLAFTDMNGAPRTWKEMLALTYTDGVVVMHKGKIVYEKYIGALDTNGQHIAMSVTKSFVGTLAAMLVHEGKLDANAPVIKYLPELKETAYGDATVRQVMDMTIGVRYSENYADPKAEIWAYAAAVGMAPIGLDYKGPRTAYDFLVGLQKEGEHDQAFAYKTANTEVLAWILRRVSGKNLATLLSERIWQKIGAEQDAYIAVDSIGAEMGGGGLNANLRDFARVGEMMRLGGKFNGQQVVPAAVVADIANGADKAKFAKAGYKLLPNWSYRNMWWVTDYGAYSARGIHGQAIYVDPKNQMVIARFGSHPIAANAAQDPLALPAYRAMAAHLNK